MLLFQIVTYSMCWTDMSHPDLCHVQFLLQYLDSLYCALMQRSCFGTASQCLMHVNGWHFQASMHRNRWP